MTTTIVQLGMTSCTYAARLDLTIAVYIMFVSTCWRQHENPWMRPTDRCQWSKNRYQRNLFEIAEVKPLWTLERVGSYRRNVELPNLDHLWLIYDEC